MSNIYYLIHSNSFGDTIASTPTLRSLSLSHRSKINVVTHVKYIFNGNPYVHNVYSFAEFENLNLRDFVKYESFRYPGQKDGNGIEKKFSCIDTRQLHSMDLGFQLLPEDMGYDFYPDPLSLDIELPKKYVVLHVTTNWANRTWDYNNWKNLIKWLKDNQFFTVLIGSGYREELHNSYSDKPLDKECPMFDNYYGLDLTNKGTMSDMWWVINESQCIVTMDSGPLHLAGTTDVDIIQLGSAINPKFRAPYRNGSQNYKYHYLGGSCNLFCNSNLYYNVKEWGDINSVPPQPNCAEDKPTFECHPSVDRVIYKLKEILSPITELEVDNYIDILPSEENDRINFNFKKSLDKKVKLEVVDFSTGLKRDRWEGNMDRLESGNYWWSPSPGKINNLGNIIIQLYLDDEYLGQKTLEYPGNKKMTIKGEDLLFDRMEDFNYSIFWEIFINKDYELNGEKFINPGDVVLDIGANYGFFSCYAINEGANRVYSVEPFEDAYNNLKNLSEKFRIFPINKAVFSGGEKAMLSLSPGTSATNCLSDYDEIFNNSGDRILVDAININNLIDSVDSYIDLLKVDCEGSELDLFESITSENLNKIGKMIIETHSDYINGFIREKLKNHNFEVRSKNNILFATSSSLVL